MLQHVPFTGTVAVGQVVVVGVGQFPSLLSGLPSAQTEVTGGQSLPRQAGSTKKHWPLSNLVPTGQVGVGIGQFPSLLRGCPSAHTGGQSRPRHTGNVKTHWPLMTLAPAANASGVQDWPAGGVDPTCTLLQEDCPSTASDRVWPAGEEGLMPGAPRVG
jgi:hypothetical protein